VGDPLFHFKYLGFGWVEALGGNGMHIVCWGMLVAAVGITIGLAYRFCATLFALGICYLFLIDQSKFMNHFYLMCLLSWVAVFLPAHRRFSLDGLLVPGTRMDVVPGWTLWILRFQMGVVYFYGGLAKLNPDWLRGNPMRQWLSNRTDLPMMQTFFESTAAPYLFSYGGLIFDLLIVPALLWKRSRLLAFCVATLFHLTNSQLFTIGIFPWLAIGLTALFFDPSWPRVALAKITRQARTLPREVTGAPAAFALKSTTLAVLGIYAVLQLTLPFRHLLYPGYSSWTEEGHRFAWHMMLRSKQYAAASFFVIDPETEQRWALDPGAYLTDRQYLKMLGNPDMLAQFAHYIKQLMHEKGFTNAQVKAVIFCKLNGRPPALLVDPEVDLGSVKRSLLAANWILPPDGQHAMTPPPNSDSAADDDDQFFDPQTLAMELDIEP
jgi:vitamin K-dependent gamma-carboxylase